MGNLFGTTQTTNSQQNSQQSGSSTNPLAGTILDYSKNSVLPMFSASNINSIAPNQWMTGAAQNQAGVGSNLFPAFNAASNIAQNGVTSMDISRFMNPYTQNVIDASNRQADFNDARSLAQAQGSGALRGSLTNSASKANQDYMRSVLTSGRDVMNANLYNTGYGNAVSNAFQNNAGILGAAQGLGSLAGAATGVNTGLGNLGQGIFQAGLAPYSLTTQGASTLGSLVPGVGSSYSGTGTQTGSSTTNQQQGLGTIAAGLLGAYLMGRRADGGAVMPAYQGHQRGIHDRLHSTVKALHGMMRSEGGAIPRFALGGGPDGYSQDRGFVSETDNDPSAMAPMTGFMNPADNDPGTAPMPSFRPTSGPVIPPFQTTTTPEPQSSMWDTFKSYLPSYDKGVWAGEKASPTQRFGMALTQVGMNNPFKDFGKSAFEQSNIEEARRQQERMQQQRMAQEAAIASGVAPGYGQTLAARTLDENRRQHDKPTWGVIGQNEFGQSTYGWINPNLAPNFSERTPGATSVMPGEPNPASVIPSSAAPGFKGGDMSKTGDEFLASLDPSTAKLVKGIAEGRIQPPSSFALQKPYWQHMTRMVGQYDPSFDAANWGARAKTAADFSAGKSAQNITSFNTAIGHLDSLYKSIDGLKNSNFPWWNSLAQSARVNTGDAKYASALKEFQTAKTAVTDELVRAFRGSGGNVHDVIQWEKNINAADSPEALKKAVTTGIELLRSRIEAMGDTYNRGMGTNKDPMSWLSPKARKALERMETGGRESTAPEQDGVRQGLATGPRVDKPAQDRLPPSNEPITRRVINKRTGQEETLMLVDGQWVKAPQ